jgi:hypothetical protein
VSDHKEEETLIIFETIGAMHAVGSFPCGKKNLGKKDEITMALVSY